MAKGKKVRREVESYTIRDNTIVVRVGDCVLMRPSDTGASPYVARVDSMEANGHGDVRVKVRWYYRPEEVRGGKRQFHGAKELFLSDHRDTQSARTIEGKCMVHSLRGYITLEIIGPEDFFCRFDYEAATGVFLPYRVAVYCKCEMPSNPDHLMVQCGVCKDRYHPCCVGMSDEHAKQLNHFACSVCVEATHGAKRPSNINTPNFEAMTELKWQGR